MGRIVVTEFVSLDGVMEDPGGAEDYKHGGWTFEFNRGEGDEFKLEETRETDALLLGRRTYQGFAAAWPSREGEFADKFNSMPKYVVSSTLRQPEWNNSTVLDGNLAEEAANLRAGGRLVRAHSRAEARGQADPSNGQVRGAWSARDRRSRMTAAPGPPPRARPWAEPAEWTLTPPFAGPPARR